MEGLLVDGDSLLIPDLVYIGDARDFGNVLFLLNSQIFSCQYLLDSLVHSPRKLSKPHECLSLVAVPELGSLLNGIRAMHVLTVFADSQIDRS